MRDAALCVMLTLLVGCGGDDGTQATDAATDAAADATPDAATDGGLDASTAFDIPGICQRICHHLFIDCIGDPAEEAKCRAGCEPDLADCSMAELMAIDGCRNVACQPGMPDPVAMCIGQVACVDG